MRNISIYMEANPNPASLKFVSNEMLFEQGNTWDYPDKESAANSPFATALFGFDYVKRVFFMNNFITITKSDEVEWMEVQHEIRNFIKAYIDEEKTIFTEGAVPPAAPEAPKKPEISMLDVKIKQILDEYVKPAVESDGGAITFVSFNEGTVKVQLQGACSGCPSSTVTLKAGIENLLKTMVPEVESVEAEGV